MQSRTHCTVEGTVDLIWTLQLPVPKYDQAFLLTGISNSVSAMSSLLLMEQWYSDVEHDKEPLVLNSESAENLCSTEYSLVTPSYNTTKQR